jgi:hypothetical protein
MSDHIMVTVEDRSHEEAMAIKDAIFKTIRAHGMRPVDYAPYGLGLEIGNITVHLNQISVYAWTREAISVMAEATAVASSMNRKLFIVCDGCAAQELHDEIKRLVKEDEHDEDEEKHTLRMAMHRIKECLEQHLKDETDEEYITKFRELLEMVDSQ